MCIRDRFFCQQSIAYELSKVRYEFVILKVTVVEKQVVTTRLVKRHCAHFSDRFVEIDTASKTSHEKACTCHSEHQRFQGETGDVHL